MPGIIEHSGQFANEMEGVGKNDQFNFSNLSFDLNSIEHQNDDLETDAQNEFTKEIKLNKNMTMARLKYEKSLDQIEYDKLTKSDSDENLNTIQSNVMDIYND